MSINQRTNEAIWTVSALNFEVKSILSRGIGRLWIEGEISNFVCPASGHWYFTLKDEKAQCRAAMFRGQNNRVGFLPKNGQQVLLRAQVTLYEARGEFQLVVDHLEDSGIGELMRRYEQLKVQLDKEGLFDVSRKQPIPAQPKKIALVTSTTGAAIRDVLSVIERRAPQIPVLVFPTPVQGDSAAESIRRALARVLETGGCDLVLLVRGGGSLEDLWCFNDEMLARTMVEFPLPIVTGIGHEIDFTIADFVADMRAPTPSVAAESVTPDRNELMQGIDEKLNRMQGLLSRQLASSQEKLSQLVHRLERQHPSRQFEQIEVRLEHAYRALLECMQKRIEQQRFRLTLNHSTLLQTSPQLALDRHRKVVQGLIEKHQLAMRRNTTLLHHRLALQARALDTLSPLKTLARGFATVNKGEQLVTSVQQLCSGDEIKLTLADGSKQAQVE